MFASSLPADELSMAQLQGHFLKYYFLSAEECVSNTSLLVSESKPKGKSKTPVHDYLRRSGLEEWSASFMLQGIYHEEDLRSNASKYLTAVNEIFRGGDAMMLDLDYEARNRMAKLLKQDELYMKHQHAFVDLVDIREAFLSNYIMQPKDNGLTCTDSSEDLNIDQYLSEYQLNNGGKKVACPLLLEKLGRKLCAAVSLNGKGVVSHYQLRSLLDCFPNRPVECVIAARGLNRSVSNEQQQPQLSLAQFLKRCAALPYFHEINDKIGGIGSTKNGNNTEEVLKQLVQEREAINSIACIPADVKAFLSSILTSLDPTTQQSISSDQSSLIPTKEMILFACPSKARIIREFVAFYSPLLTTTSDSAVQHPDGEENASSNSCGVTNTFDESYERPVSLLRSLKHEDIEDLAYEFSMMILGSANHTTKATVSLLELRNYLNMHKQNPFEAVDKAAVQKALLSLALPVAAPPKTTPSKWVYTFLQGSDGKSTYLADNYWMNFVTEGMGDESDWLDGPVISDGILSGIFKVKKLGERRKIIQMHEQLLKN